VERGLAPPGTKFLGRRLGICSKLLRLCCGGGRSLHAVPHFFRPYADSVARATLVTLLLGPFAIIGLAYRDHAIELHH